MWSMNVSVGTVTTAAAWVAAVGLIVISWAVDVIYLSFLGMIFVALGVTLALSREHHRTRRHVYLVARVTEPPPGEELDRPIANLSRVRQP